MFGAGEGEGRLNPIERVKGERKGIHSSERGGNHPRGNPGDAEARTTKVRGDQEPTLWFF